MVVFRLLLAGGYSDKPKIADAVAAGGGMQGSTEYSCLVIRASDFTRATGTVARLATREVYRRSLATVPV